MKIVDVNVLLYAIDVLSPHHERVRKWWETALSGGDLIGFAWIVVLGFLRVATNRRAFPNPLPVDQAISEMAAWLAHPNVRLVSETDEHWQVLRDLLNQTGTAGNLTTDAHLAALAIAHGAVLVSCDADFARFTHLRWLNPLQD